ncbi:MAG: sugar phosphate isomerase/epimerase [Pirellulales bacterium]
MVENQLPLLLTAYGLPYSMGYIPLQDGSANPSPWTVIELMDQAAELGLSGIEIPLTSRVPSFEGRTIEVVGPADDLGERLREREMRIVADYGVVVENDVEAFRQYLRMAKRTGAAVVRATLSNVLCGDRRTCPGGWPARLEAVAARLREVFPLAEELGLTIALENHQDATTDDLLRLADMVGNHPSFGITFDTGNPLAMAEDPVDAANRMAHLIRHVHLKDYTIHFAPQGYRLVRCAAGNGVIDFSAILAIVRANGHTVVPGIEIAAQTTRTSPFLDRGWWSTYPPRDAAELVGLLQILWSQGRPASEPYSSAWERGASPEEVLAEEWEVVKQSVEYFRSNVLAPLAWR